MKILLVEPNFPILTISRNHHSFLPIGLLKLASYHRAKGQAVRLTRGNHCIPDFAPNEILITSLFTYWSKHVHESVHFYKEAYPSAKITVGGIYATLMPEHCKASGCDEVFLGIHKGAEKFLPAYDLVDVDYQIIHTSRGCTRRCRFCGTWKLEPEFAYKNSIKDEICKNRIIFYDNNLLANPHIEEIFAEVRSARINGQPVIMESQCGIDGRLLTPELARLLRKSDFTNPRIAWDSGYKDHGRIKEQIKLLTSAGYPPRSIYVFMLFNYRLDYQEMLKKVAKCRQWGVQVADCRYRPLNLTCDNYSPYMKRQTGEDYYIHPNWTDSQIRTFRRKVRQQNICIRYNFHAYDSSLEAEGRRLREIRRVARPVPQPLFCEGINGSYL